MLLDAARGGAASSVWARGAHLFFAALQTARARSARDHHAYIDLAAYADWRLRQLREAPAPTRIGRAFTAAVVTAA
jgi:hypothetical protein